MEKYREIGVGIDVGKNHHTAILKDQDGNLLTGFLHLDNRRASVETLLDQIHTAQQALGGAEIPVTVNMEATGPYHVPLFCALSPLFRVNLWQPRQAKETSKKNIRKAKTDKRDAGSLAMLHRTPNMPPPLTRYENPLLIGARQVARYYYSVLDTRTNLAKLLAQEVFLANPSFDTVVNPATATGRRLLKAAPTPQALIDLGEAGIGHLLAVGGRRIKAHPSDILRMAQETLRAPCHEAAATYAMGSLWETLDFLHLQTEKIRSELQAYWDQLRGDTVLQTFPSMGWFRALVLHVEFGGLRRFPTADAAVAYSGLENYVYQSEGKLVNGSMTKAGPRFIRRVLWELLGNPSTEIPKITEGIERRRAQGKHWNEAVHAAAKKTIRVLWAMERDQVPYHRPRPNEGKPVSSAACQAPTQGADTFT